VRRELGVRTVFNLLGPLTNPAEPPYALIGAYSLEAAGLMAEALSGMPVQRAFVVHGTAGWDEATPVGPFELCDVHEGRVTRERRDPLDLGVPRCTTADLAGGSPAQNAEALRAVFDGRDRGAHRDALALNAALALELTGTVGSCAEGIAAAYAAIDRGAAAALLTRLAMFGREPGN
jgi:anthranilate phosphoribosyltransferase